MQPAFYAAVEGHITNSKASIMKMLQSRTCSPKKRAVLDEQSYVVPHLQLSGLGRDCPKGTLSVMPDWEVHSCNRVSGLANSNLKIVLLSVGEEPFVK